VKLKENTVDELSFTEKQVLQNLLTLWEILVWSNIKYDKALSNVWIMATYRLSFIPHNLDFKFITCDPRQRV